MKTAVLEIPDELINRVTTLAKLVDKSPRALMLEIIVKHVVQVEMHLRKSTIASDSTPCDNGLHENIE